MAKPQYGKAEHLSVSVGEDEVFLDADIDTENGFHLTPDEAEKLAEELQLAARKARTMRYGN